MPHAENPFRQQMGWQDKFVVMYSGNIGISHVFEDILEVAKRLRHRKELLFVFIGRGPRLPEIEQYKVAQRLETWFYFPFNLKTTWPRLLAPEIYILPV